MLVSPKQTWCSSLWNLSASVAMWRLSVEPWALISASCRSLALMDCRPSLT